MFLSITSRGENSDKLSYVVMKHPDKIFKRDNLTAFFPVYEKEYAELVSIVTYPEYKLWKETNTLDVDNYVTDREYALSSLFCKELKTSFNTAIAGSYESSPELKDINFNFEVKMLPFVTNLKEEDIKGLWEPLGYQAQVSLHHEQREWLPKKFQVYQIQVSKTCSITRLLRDILALIPVIDNYIHFIPTDIIVEQLEKLAGEWIETHPKKEFIAKRFLRYKKKLYDKFVDKEEEKQLTEFQLEEKLGLGEMRREWFVNKIKELNPRSVVDAGCGSGRLLEDIIPLNVVDLIGFDCSPKMIKLAGNFTKKKATVFFSSLCYYDERLKNKDVFCLQEVIEHMGEFQLSQALKLLFEVYKSKAILMSTPNKDFNVNWGFDSDKLRDWDHKFEFTENEGKGWAQLLADKYNYEFTWEGIGQNFVPKVNGEVVEKIKDVAPTQGFLFKRKEN